MDLFDIEINENDAKKLADFINEFKTQEIEKMKIALEESTKIKMEEIDKHLKDYKEQLQEQYIDQTNQLIEALKPQLKKQILVEMVETNPELQLMEQIKTLLFPVISENGKSYVNEISLLKKEIETLKKTKELSEGAIKKENLLSQFSDETKTLFDKMIGEGSVVEVTEKFYELVETFKGLKEFDKYFNQIDDNTTQNTVTTEQIKIEEQKIVENKQENITTSENNLSESEKINNKINNLEENFSTTVETQTVLKNKPKENKKEVVNNPNRKLFNKYIKI